MSGIRARARPRVRSVSFKRLGWVLEREAALCVIFPDILDTALEPDARQQIHDARRARLRATVSQALRDQSRGLFYPAAHTAAGALHTTESAARAEQFHAAGYPPAVGLTHYRPILPT